MKEIGVKHVLHTRNRKQIKYMKGKCAFVYYNIADVMSLLLINGIKIIMTKILFRKIE